MSTLLLTDSILALCDELCHSLTLLTDALSGSDGGCIRHLSESHRRATTLALDLHAYLFTAFCPPLERVPSMLTCQRLHAAVGAVFEGGLYLSPKNAPDARRATELQSLCRMAEQLRLIALTLPRLTGHSRPPSPPDAHAFYAEHTKVRAAHALHALHHDREESGRLLSLVLRRICDALCDAHGALLLLVAQSI